MASTSYQIFVKTLTLRRYVLNVNSTDTIATVKQKIEDKGGLPVHEQRLWFGGRLLDDNRPLSDYNIKKEANLFVWPRVTHQMKKKEEDQKKKKDPTQGKTILPLPHTHTHTHTTDTLYDEVVRDINAQGKITSPLPPSLHTHTHSTDALYDEVVSDIKAQGKIISPLPPPSTHTHTALTLWTMRLWVISRRIRRRNCRSIRLPQSLVWRCVCVCVCGMCIRVYVYVCVSCLSCVSLYVCMCVYVCVCVCIFLVYLCLYACVYVCVCVCMYLYVCMCVRVYVCVYLVCL